MTQEMLSKLVKELHEAQNSKNKEKTLQALLKLSEYHYTQKNYTKSGLILREIEEKQPSFPQINYYLSLIALQESDTYEALKYVDKELQLNPKNKNAKELKEHLTISTNIPMITLSLILINCLAFFFTYPTLTFTQLIQFTLSSSTLGISQAISSLFYHANLVHFALNMSMLLIFGLVLEKHIGSLKFLSIYITAGVLGNIAQVLLFAENSFVLGASAGLFGLIGSLLMRQPLLNMKILGFLKVPLVILFGGFFSLSTLIQEFMPTLFANSGDIAHLTGLMIGILFTAFYYKNTIATFYHWLGIATGFWLLSLFIGNMLRFSQVDSLFVVYEFILFVGSFFLIWFSYKKLKISLELRGERV